MKYMNAAKKYGVGVATFGTATYALAAPDVESITTAIDGVGANVDAVGGAFMTVLVGIAAFGLILGMISRKGR